MLRVLLTLLIVSIAGVLALPPPSHVIFASRHGIRRQFPSAVHDFSLYAPGKTFATSNEEWGVEPGFGVLTRHGYEAAKLMGKFQASRYSHLLQGACQENNPFFIYAEEDMPRDLLTAEAFFLGFLPANQGCELPSPYTKDVEYLIDQGSKPRGGGKCKLGDEAQVSGRIGNHPEELTRLNAQLLAKLNDALGCCDRSLCPPGFTGEKCTLLDIPHRWDPEPKHWYNTFLGPVYAGKYFSEWFLLTLLNGMDFALGALSQDEVLQLASFVTQYRALEFNMLAARPFGSAFLAHIVATMDQWVNPDASLPVSHSSDARAVFYAAHDTNLLYVAELLNLHWLNKDWQPRQTPPGGMLVFELYRMDAGWAVQAFFDVQTPTQIRGLQTLNSTNAPDRAPVTIPGCSEGPDLLCPFATFKRIALQAVATECIELMDLQQYASGSEASGGFPVWFLVLFFLLIVAALLLFGAYVRRDQRRKKRPRGDAHETVQLLGV